MSTSTLTPSKPNASCHTEVKVDHLSYEWVIKKFSLLLQETGEFIYSPVFSTAHNQANWTLCVYPHGKKKEYADYVSLFLHLHSANSRIIRIKVHAELSILPGGARNTFTHTFKGISGYGTPRMIIRSELLKACPDDTITIRCEIDVPRETITVSNESLKCEELDFDLDEGRMSQDFCTLYRDSKFSDVTLIVENEKFRVHKAVLAARSPAFSAMFESTEMQEDGKNVVTIEKMTSEVVKAMVEYFYTDEVTNLEAIAFELLEASDRYRVQRLRGMCEQVLCKKLNKENAAETLVHADLYHSDRLKEVVKTFMAEHLVDVVESNGYKLMADEYPALVKELLYSFAQQQKPKKRRLTQ